MRIILVFLIMISISGFRSESAGQIAYSWQGTIDSDWQKAGNWSPVRNPTAETDEIIFSNTGSVSVTNIPTQTIRKINILGNSDVTLNFGGTTLTISSYINDAIKVESSSVLTLSGGKLRANDRNGLVGNFYGKVIVSAGAELSKGGQAVLNFHDGSVFEYDRSGGILPSIIWDDGATCVFKGVTNALPGNLNQTYGNLVWNCTGQTISLDLNLNGTIQGDFSIVSTNSRALNLNSTSINTFVTINGDFSQASGELRLCTGAGNTTMSVGGDFNLTGGKFYLAAGTSTPSVYVDGNVTIQGVSTWLNLSDTDTYSNFYVGGNFSFPSGSVFANDGYANVRFNGSSTQIFTSGGTFLYTVNYIVESGATLQMGTTLIPSSIWGGGTFTLEEGATLRITDPNGITGNGNGNIRVSGSRTYNSGANYVYLYDGITTAYTGDGLPAGTVTGNVTIAAGATIRTTNSITCSGALEVNGTLVPAAAQVIGGTGTLQGSGFVKVTRTDATADFNSQYSIQNKSLSNLTVDYAAIGGGQVVSAGNFGNLRLLNSSGTNTVGGNIAISGTLTTTAGGSLNLGTAQAIVNNLLISGPIIINSDNNISGSLIATAASGSGKVTYNRQLRTETNDGDFHFVGSPVSGNTATNSSKVSKVYYYNEVTGEWLETNMTSLVSGRGYNIDQTSSSDGLITFTGSLVTGNVTFNATSPYGDTFDGEDYDSRTFANGTGHSSIVRNNTDAYGAGGWNLLGNPYTSAVDAEAFVTYNNSQFDPNYKAVYIYDGTVGEKGVYKYIAPSAPGQELGGSFGSPDIQTGQGFYVLAMNDFSTFTFTPDMRGHNTTVPMTKSADEPWPAVNLKVGYGLNESSTVIVYNENMKPGLDPGYDIGQLSTSPGVEIFTTLAASDNGVWFARQALPMAGYDEYIVTVGLATENGGTVTFSADIIPITGYKFYLEDRLAGTFTDLHDDEYTVAIPEQTYGTGRFYIWVSDHVLTGTEPDPVAGNVLDVRVWTSRYQVHIDGMVSDKAITEVFDMTGRKLLERRLSGSDYNTFTVPSTAGGVHLIKVTDGIKVYTRKVIFQ